MTMLEVTKTTKVAEVATQDDCQALAETKTCGAAQIETVDDVDAGEVAEAAAVDSLLEDALAADAAEVKDKAEVAEVNADASLEAADQAEVIDDGEDVDAGKAADATKISDGVQVIDDAGAEVATEIGEAAQTPEVVVVEVAEGMSPDATLDLISLPSLLSPDETVVASDQIHRVVTEAIEDDKKAVRTKASEFADAFAADAAEVKKEAKVAEVSVDAAAQVADQAELTAVLEDLDTGKAVEETATCTCLPTMEANELCEDGPELAQGDRCQPAVASSGSTSWKELKTHLQDTRVKAYFEDLLQASDEDTSDTLSWKQLRTQLQDAEVKGYFQAWARGDSCVNIGQSTAKVTPADFAPSVLKSSESKEAASASYASTQVGNPYERSGGSSPTGLGSSASAVNSGPLDGDTEAGSSASQLRRTASLSELSPQGNGLPDSMPVQQIDVEQKLRRLGKWADSCFGVRGQSGEETMSCPIADHSFCQTHAEHASACSTYCSSHAGDPEPLGTMLPEAEDASYEDSGDFDPGTDDLMCLISDSACSLLHVDQAMQELQQEMATNESMLSELKSTCNDVRCDFEATQKQHGQMLQMKEETHADLWESTRSTPSSPTTPAALSASMMAKSKEAKSQGILTRKSIAVPCADFDGFSYRGPRPSIPARRKAKSSSRKSMPSPDEMVRWTDSLMQQDDDPLGLLTTRMPRLGPASSSGVDKASKEPRGASQKMASLTGESDYLHREVCRAQGCIDSLMRVAESGGRAEANGKISTETRAPSEFIDGAPPCLDSRLHSSAMWRCWCPALMSRWRTANRIGAPCEDEGAQR